MNKNFWETLKKPFFCSAPMYGVTDEAFRRMMLKYGRPDVFWTEMVPADGLVYMAERLGLDSKRGRSMMQILRFVHQEKPIVCQIFGAKPENFYKSAVLLRSMGFDAIDINAGCPEKNIEKQGAGAALIKNPGLVKEIILAVKEAAVGIPVSLKTRLGYEKISTEDWIGYLLGQGLDALTIHCRTRKEEFGGRLHWGEIKKSVALRNEMKSKTLVIGSGGIMSLKDAEAKAKESGVDGVMVGQALIGNPWFFGGLPAAEKVEEARLRAILEHVAIFNETFGEEKSFDDLKKHFAAYASGFEGAKELRMALMRVKSTEEARRVVAEFSPKR